eukprot:9823718-Heterocapsa_arctica.AAC.1
MCPDVARILQRETAQLQKEHMIITISSVATSSLTRAHLATRRPRGTRTLARRDHGSIHGCRGKDPLVHAEEDDEEEEEEDDDEDREGGEATVVERSSRPTSSAKC